MAIAIIGGLVSSTVLTLVVVPVFYTLLERLKRGRRAEAPAHPSDTPARAAA
jgi:HAE1 family hydrophobic/amphiphilic exporter-1